MFGFGRLFRGATVAASVALGAYFAAADEPAPLPASSPDRAVEPASGIGRTRGASGGAACQPCLPCQPGTLPPGSYLPSYPSPGHPAPGIGEPTPSPMAQPMNPPSTNPMNPAQPPPAAPAPAAQPPAAAPDFGDLASGAGVGPTVGIGGYLDNPIPISTVRLRFDAAYGVNRPDRSEFFWASWKELSYHPHPVSSKGGNFQGAYFDPNARGPEHFYNSLNYQEILPYIELAFTRRLSAFVELPTRFVQAYTVLEEGNPASEKQAVGPNRGKFFPEPKEENTEVVPRVLRTSGFSDMNAGFKYALVADPSRFLTFQFRTYIPTGDPSLGLGTGHVSLEPGLLLYQRLTSRLVFQGQLRDWIPISNAHSQADPGFPASTIGGGVTSATGRRFDGNILIYGLGAGYDVIQRGNFRVTPVAEFVGWTVFNGLETVAGSGFGSGLPVGVDLPTTHSVHDVSGTTIINAKFGVRTSFWNGHSTYVGYGHALTGARWYKDILRVEYRVLF